MTNELSLSTINIPYGVLHDSYLSGVKFENNIMTFSFDIEIFPQNYTDDAFYKHYEQFKHCNMIVEIHDEFFNYYNFISGVKQSGKYKGIFLEREEFLYVINDVFKTTFIDCSVSAREFLIFLSVDDYYPVKRKRKKYKKYSDCMISLDATKVTWEWY